MSQETEIVARDRDAGKYEEWYLARGYYYDWVERNTIMKFMDLKPGDVVLDAGSGTGRLARDIARICKKVYCMDFSPKSIDVLNKKASEEGIGNIHARVHDLTNDLPATDAIDKIVCVQVIQHLPDDKMRVKVLKNFYDRLKPGGICVVSVYNWNARFKNRSLKKIGKFPSGIDYFRFFPPEAKSLLDRAGFKDVRVRGCVNLKGYGRNYPFLKYIAKSDLLLSGFGISCLLGDFLIVTGRK